MSDKLDAVLAAAVESGAAPNIVAVAADCNGLIYSGAAGPRKVGEPGDVGTDTVYGIASMTKMVTTVAALQLVEQGRLDLDKLVAHYLPEWDKLQVLEGFDRDTPRLRAPRITATVANLITHTTGLTYCFWNADMVRYEELGHHPNLITGQLAALQAPLVADAGTRFEYGTNIDFLGRVVEVVSGRSLDTYFAEHILGPLGMAETGFVPRPDQASRRVSQHVPAEGAWAPIDFALPTEPEYWSGGHGLYSTPNDYLRFQQMLLRGGEFGGVRILSANAVADCFVDHLGGLSVPEVLPTAFPMHSCDMPYGPNRTWGWGLLLNRDDVPGGRAAYSGAWAGLANTHFWVDPTRGVTGAIYSQFFPFAAPDYMAVYTQFEKAVYELI